MSIALSNRVIHLEERIARLEEALNILLRAERAHEPAPVTDFEELPVITKIKNDIQGIKMRMGKQ